MNKDIRLSVDFFDHPKTMKLIRVMGLDGVFCLQRLWCFCGKYRPEGTLDDMDVFDIELAARWTGEQGEFVSGMVKLKWIDCVDGVYTLHDWHDHNGFAVHAKEREDQARKAAEKRWKKRYGSSDADADSNAHSNADSNPVGNAPIPSPIPIPIPSPIPTPSPTTAAVTESVITDSDPEEGQRPAAVEQARMPVSECRKLYREYFGVIHENQPIVTVLTDICRLYPPENIRAAFMAAPGAGANSLNWVVKRLQNGGKPAKQKTDWEALIREHEAEEARNGLPVHG